MKTPWLLASALLFVSLPGLTQMTPKGPVAGQEKARCTAVAACESGTVECTSTRSSTSCSAEDFDCSGVRGSVTCDGRTTLCPLFGDVCHLERRPAATLLLPYFEIAPGGRDTLISVSNAYKDPVLVHAQVWTDLGVYVFGFHIYLAGNAVQSLSLSKVMLSNGHGGNGDLPSYPLAGTYPNCPDPSRTSQDLSDLTRQNVEAALQGLSSLLFNGQCGGFDHGDSDVLRGYMTFQVVNDCTFLLPNTQGYFLPRGTGIASNKNVLKGDYFYLDLPVETPSGISNRVKAGLPMVHIRASCTDPAVTSSTRYTFYGASTGWLAYDNRQPLPTGFQVRFLTNPNPNPNPPSLGTDLIVWRDPKVVQAPFRCGTLPLWYPLAQEGLEGFDEQGNSFSFPAKSTPFGLVAQRVHIGSGGLDVPAQFGWLSLNLNGIVATASTVPPFDPAAQQAWVTVLYNNDSTGVLMDASWLDTACEALHQR